MSEWHGMAFLNLSFTSTEVRDAVLDDVGMYGFDVTEDGELWVHGTVIFDYLQEIEEVLKIINVQGVSGWYDVYQFHSSYQIPYKQEVFV